MFSRSPPPLRPVVVSEGSLRSLKAALVAPLRRFSSYVETKVKDFPSGLIRLIFGNGLTPLLGFLIAPFIARSLEPDGRGIYAAYSTALAMAGILGTFGSQDALAYLVSTRRLSTHRAVKWSLQCLVPASVAMAMLLTASSFGLFSNSETRQLFMLLMACLPVQILLNVLVGISTGRRDTNSIIVLQVVPAATRLATILPLTFSPWITPFSAAACFLLSPLPALLWVLVRLLRRAEDGGPTECADTISRREVAWLSTRSYPAVLAGVANSRLDQIIALPLIGASQLGFYAAAVTLGELPQIAIVAARAVAQGASDENREAQQVKLLRLAVLLTAVASLPLALIAHWAVPLIFGGAFDEAIPAVYILLGGAVVLAAGSTAGGILLREGRVGTQSLCAVMGAIAGLSGILLLANLGAMGLALATLVGYSTSAAASIVSLKRLAVYRELSLLTGRTVGKR